jgi:hypothetical protein
LISSVIERWRSATMSQKMVTYDDEADFGSSSRDDAAPLQPTHQPSIPATPPLLDPQRFKSLKAPLERVARTLPMNDPTRWRS